jgi:hypothetical protein
MVFIGLSGIIPGICRNLFLSLITSFFLLPGFYNHAHGEEEKVYSRKEAFQASGERDMKTFEIINPKIILHYGEGIKDADLLAEVLRERGYRAFAFPGGPKGMVEIMVGAGILKNKYDQRALDRGTIGGIAEDIYNTKFGKPEKSYDNGMKKLEIN